MQTQHSRGGIRRFLSPMVLLVCAFLFASSGAAFAYFSVTGSGNASAKATTLGAGKPPSTTVSGRDVTLSWSAFTNATSYTVARSNVSPQSLATTLNGSCAGNPTGTSCTDTGVVENGTAATNWTYTDTPNVHNWIGGASPASPTVTVPGPTLSVGSSSVTSVGGTANTVTAAHYFDNEMVTYCVDNDTTSCPAADQTSPTTATVPATGGTVTTTTLTLPAGLTGGSHTLYAKGSSGSDPAGVSFNVAKVTPTITTSTSPSSITVGGSVDDQATVSGGYNPTGTITWSLYASTDTTCSGTVFFTTSIGGTISGDNTYTSGSFTTTAANSYKWGFSYNGDSHNNPVSACGGTNESLTVNKATPSLSTNATASVSVGGTVTDTATLANGYNPTGTITYTLYGPSPTQSCTSQVGQVTSSVNSGNNTYTSPTITPPSAGTYWWIANYGSDTNNAATTNGCGQSGESSVVTKVTPTITTNASPASITVGGSVADQATISGGFSPTGTITWKLYASTDTTCSGTVFFTSTAQTVTGNALYTSSSFTTNAVGTYKWGFSYTGDANNNPVSACGGANETLTVNAVTPTITTTATPSSVTVGGAAADQATVSGGFSPTGTITWKLYNNSGCTGSPVFSTSTGGTVSGNSTYTSSNFTTTTTGTFTWQFSYTGDSNNNPVSACGGTGETLTVSVAKTTAGSYTLTVPAGVTSFTFTMNGAGGGGGQSGAAGGSGGTVSGTITIPVSGSATTFTVIVGGAGGGGTNTGGAGGLSGTGCALGGVGGGGTDAGGGGGGSTCIYLQGAPAGTVVSVGGGGGGGGVGVGTGGKGGGGPTTNPGTNPSTASDLDGATSGGSGGTGGKTVTSGSPQYAITNTAGKLGGTGTSAGTCSAGVCGAGGAGTTGTGNKSVGGGGGGGGMASGGGATDAGSGSNDKGGGGGGGSAYTGGTATISITVSSASDGGGSAGGAAGVAGTAGSVSFSGAAGLTLT